MGKTATAGCVLQSNRREVLAELHGHLAHRQEPATGHNRIVGMGSGVRCTCRKQLCWIWGLDLTVRKILAINPATGHGKGREDLVLCAEKQEQARWSEMRREKSMSRKWKGAIYRWRGGP